MSDLVIGSFGSVRVDTDAKNISINDFSGVQNIERDIFSSIQKRNGYTKVNTTALAGAILGITQLLGRNYRRHLVVAALDNIYSDPNGYDSPGDNPPVEDPDPVNPDPDIDDTGCCNYGTYPGTCIRDVTRTECFDTYGGNFWIKGGNCTHTPPLGCIRHPGEHTSTTSTTSSTTTTTTTTTTSTTTTTTTSTSSSTTQEPGFYCDYNIVGGGDCSGAMTELEPNCWFKYCPYIIIEYWSDTNAYEISVGGCEASGTLTLGVEETGICSVGGKTWTLTISETGG